jgi:lysozyme
VNQHREYEAGLKIAAKMIEPFEGFRSRPYWDPYGRVWTQGFGETRGITRQSRPISRREAHKRLINRLRRDFLPAVIEAARAQHDHATHPINRNRVAALLSLIYNTGPGSIMRGTTIGNAIRRRDYRAAAAGFMLWTRSGGQVLQGLVNRRRSEVRRFNRRV